MSSDYLADLWFAIEARFHGDDSSLWQFGDQKCQICKRYESDAMFVRCSRARCNEWFHPYCAVKDPRYCVRGEMPSSNDRSLQPKLTFDCKVHSLKIDFCICHHALPDQIFTKCSCCCNWFHSECLGVDLTLLKEPLVCSSCQKTPPHRGLIEMNQRKFSRYKTEIMAHMIIETACWFESVDKFVNEFLYKKSNKDDLKQAGLLFTEGQHFSPMQLECDVSEEDEEGNAKKLIPIGMQERFDEVMSSIKSAIFQIEETRMKLLSACNMPKIWTFVKNDLHGKWLMSVDAIREESKELCYQDGEEFTLYIPGSKFSIWINRYKDMMNWVSNLQQLLIQNPPAPFKSFQSCMTQATKFNNISRVEMIIEHFLRVENMIEEWRKVAKKMNRLVEENIDLLDDSMKHTPKNMKSHLKNFPIFNVSVPEKDLLVKHLETLTMKKPDFGINIELLCNEGSQDNQLLCNEENEHSKCSVDMSESASSYDQSSSDVEMEDAENSESDENSEKSELLLSPTYSEEKVLNCSRKRFQCEVPLCDQPAKNSSFCSESCMVKSGNFTLNMLKSRKSMFLNSIDQSSHDIYEEQMNEMAFSTLQEKIYNEDVTPFIQTQLRFQALFSEGMINVNLQPNDLRCHILSWHLKKELERSCKCNDGFKQKARALIFNLGEDRNNELLVKILSGNMDIKKVCQMKSEEFASNVLQLKRKQLEETYIADRLVKNDNALAIQENTFEGSSLNSDSSSLKWINKGGGDVTFSAPKKQNTKLIVSNPTKKEVNLKKVNSAVSNSAKKEAKLKKVDSTVIETTEKVKSSRPPSNILKIMIGITNAKKEEKRLKEMEAAEKKNGMLPNSVYTDRQTKK